MWKQCHHCGRWCDIEKTKETHGIIYFHGKEAGVICPDCTDKFKEKKEEKKEVKQCMNIPKDH